MSTEERGVSQEEVEGDRKMLARRGAGGRQQRGASSK